MNHVNSKVNFDVKFLVLHIVSLNLLFKFAGIEFVEHVWQSIFDNYSVSFSFLIEQFLIFLFLLAICHLFFVTIMLTIDFIV